MTEITRDVFPNSHTIHGTLHLAGKRVIEKSLVTVFISEIMSTATSLPNFPQLAGP
jgi:hypothetical protein